MTQHGKRLYEMYISQMQSPFQPKWEALTPLSQSFWELLARDFIGSFTSSDIVLMFSKINYKGEK